MRDPLDFYETPAWAIDHMLAIVDLPSPTLDPAAGTGALMLGVLRRWPNTPIVGYEIDHDRARVACERIDSAPRSAPAVEHGDSLPHSWAMQRVIMNPPYSLAQRFVEKSVREAVSTVALLRLGFLASMRRKTFLENNPPNALIVLSKRPSFTADGRTDATEYAWFVWHRWPRGISGFHWIAP